MSVKLKPSEDRWIGIYEQLQEDKVELFLNTHLEPTVMIPNDGFQTEWPVDSQRFRDYLVSVYYEISNGEMLRSNECEFLMSQIREECRKGGRRLTAPESVETDEDVIVQGILYLANSSKNTTPVFNDRTVVLLQKLRNIQKDGVISNSDEIPFFTNIFSRRLARLIPVLRGYGVEVVMEHKDSGSHSTLTRLPTFQKESSLEDTCTDGSTKKPSGESSGGTIQAGMDLPLTDDADGELRVDPPQALNGASEPKNLATAKKGGAK